MANGRIQSYVLDVVYYGENLNNLHLIYMIGPLQMDTSIVFVQCMNCIVVSILYMVYFSNIEMYVCKMPTNIIYLYHLNRRGC